MPGANTDRFALLKCQQDMHSATVCEVAFRKYLQADDLDSHLNYLRALNSQRREVAREIIRQYFPKEAIVWIPEGGFLLWVELPQQIDIEAVYQAALLKNVAFSRGTGFFTTPEAKVSSMRLNCSAPDGERARPGLGDTRQDPWIRHMNKKFVFHGVYLLIVGIVAGMYQPAHRRFRVQFGR